MVVSISTMRSGASSRVSCPTSPASCRGPTTAECWTASSIFCEPVLLGATCQSGTGHTRRRTFGTIGGPRPASGCGFSMPWQSGRRSPWRSFTVQSSAPTNTRRAEKGGPDHAKEDCATRSTSSWTAMACLYAPIPGRHRPSEYSLSQGLYQTTLQRQEQRRPKWRLTGPPKSALRLNAGQMRQ